MRGVRISINSTGVVSGEFGFVEAWRTKKKSLAEWLAYERLAVKAFSEKHIAELDRMIVAAQRRAETEREMRIRSYDKDDDGDNEGERQAVGVVVSNGPGERLREPYAP